MRRTLDQVYLVVLYGIRSLLTTIYWWLEARNR